MRTCVRDVAGGIRAPSSKRAVERGNLLQAKALAKVVAAHAGRLSLGDALSLLFLVAAKRDRSYEPAALRWIARFLLEGSAVTIEEAHSTTKDRGRWWPKRL